MICIVSFALKCVIMYLFKQKTIEENKKACSMKQSN